MRIPYHSAGDQVPSPALVAAWFKIEDLATEQVPLWAAHWIADGKDGETLRILAGLDGSDPHEVRDTLVAALADTGTPIPSDLPEAITTVYRDLAQLHLAGKISAEQLIFKVARLVSSSDLADEYFDQPLGAAYGFHYEWTCGCGHCSTPEELQEPLREACMAQISQHPNQQPSG
ncbi:hypothetical protein ACGFNU_49940 [Spirillospora sp. NPDC048911]|uniref:hypothetical protein n=1 Tax=Spirillospora sp. NPDC048911 TaxID=3364527 RepID=UPI003710E269